MQEEIFEFLSNVSRHSALTEHDIEEIHIFFRVVDETESIGDYAQRLVMLSHVMNEKNLTFSQAAIKDLKLLFQELINFLTLAKSCFMMPDKAIAAQCNEKKISTKNLIKEANEAHNIRLQDGVCQIMPSISFNNFLNNHRGLRSHVVNIVEASMGEK